jgi:histidine kinase-like protein
VLQERQAVSVRISGGRGAPHAARVAIRSRLDGRVSPERVTDAALAVTELVANTVRHAGAGPAEDIGVEVLLVADRIRLCVIDSGSTKPPHIIARERGEPGGLGLVVVDGPAAAWGVARDGGGVKGGDSDASEQAAPAPADDSSTLGETHQHSDADA